MNRRDVAAAGHTGDATIARQGLVSPEATVRATALGALERLGLLTAREVSAALVDPAPEVRRRAAEAAARFPEIPMLRALTDDDWSVVEMACWAVGEHETATPDVLDRLCHLAGEHPEALVREAAVAALGAVGDAAGLPAIVAATRDKPAVRRRAAVALAPFDTPEAETALRRLLHDRDWQTRQIAEDLLDERPV